MLFHSPEFLVLLALTLAAYLLFPRTRIYVLALANAIFYGAAGFPYLVLFLVMSALVYYCSLTAGRPRARIYLWLGVGASLLNLAYFKYTGFVLSNVERFLHLGIEPAVWRLVLPVGISFYTFQLVAYLVDVHRGQIAPASSLLRFWVFIAFFGQLIAGPIMRGGDFLPQVEANESRWASAAQFKQGVFLLAWGLMKKVMLADMLSPIVDGFFQNAAALGSLESWLAAYLFGFQIYYDFSAYSDMALGIGHLFGYQLATNFRTPYLAQNPAEFWRRWHITLSSWIRDYIYIPLGGSRLGGLRQYVNLFAAMVLSGLWHGAAWTFVAWGVIHGGISVLHKLYQRYVSEHLPLHRWQAGVAGGVLRWTSILLMFHATTVAWVFFRADGLGAALTMTRHMLLPADLHLHPANGRYLVLVALLFLLHVGEYWLVEKGFVLYQWWTATLPAPVRALSYAAVAAAILLFSRTDQVAFIYFRF